MRYKIHVITPVHIGSGIRLGKMDYIKRNKDILVIDIKLLAALPEVDPEELSELLYLSEFQIEDFLRRKGIYPTKIAARSVRCECDPRGDILCCLKDGTGRAYLPGSSIKGALRTAILWERIKDNPEEARAKISSILKKEKPKSKRMASVSEDLEKQFLGHEPKYDHLRALRVSDSMPLSSENLEVFKVSLVSLVNDSLMEKMSLYVEAIRPGTETDITIDLDEFISRDDIASKLAFKVDDLRQLENVTRAYCKDYIDNEVRFFSKYKLTYDGKMLMDLKKLLLLTEKRGGMILRLGWGGGWNGMTVGRLFPELLNEMRSAFNLGKLNVAEFPKTRRLALVDKEMQSMGWVWLKPI